MTSNEKRHSVPLTDKQFMTVRNCLIEFERMGRQKIMKNQERGEHIKPEALALLVDLAEINDIIDEEWLKIAYRNGVSHGKQC